MQNSPAFYAVVIYSSFVLCFILLAILYYGILCNSIVDQHITLLANVKHEVQRAKVAALQRQLMALTAAAVASASTGSALSPSNSSAQQNGCAPNGLPAPPLRVDSQMAPPITDVPLEPELKTADSQHQLTAPGAGTIRTLYVSPSNQPRPSAATSPAQPSVHSPPPATNVVVRATTSTTLSPAVPSSGVNPNLLSHPSPSIEFHEHLVSLLQSSIDILKADDSVTYVALAGFRVSETFVRAVAGIVASVFAIALRQILLGSTGTAV